MQDRYQLAIQLSHALPLVLTAWREPFVACWVGLKSLSIYFGCWRGVYARRTALLIGPSDLLLFRVLLFSDSRPGLISKVLTKHFYRVVFDSDYFVPTSRILVLLSHSNVLYNLVS